MKRKSESWPGKIVTTAEFDRWFRTLSKPDYWRMQEILDRLAAIGPAVIDGKQAARLTGNGKGLFELRVQTFRVLFVFDPRRNAVLLCGGDKAGKWTKWYRPEIELAWRLYDTYLASQPRQPGART